MPNNEDRVPTTAPYGGITDGSVYCTRCGEERTGCSMCAGELRSLKAGRSTAYRFCIGDENAK